MKEHDAMDEYVKRVKKNEIVFKALLLITMIALSFATPALSRGLLKARRASSDAPATQETQEVSKSQDEDTLVPPPFAIPFAEGEDITAPRQYKPGKNLFGRFTVENNAMRPFVLRLTFDNAGKLVLPAEARRGRRDGGEATIGMNNFELRYKDPNDVWLTKMLADAVSGSNGYVYELLFLQEDLQLSYDMELWGRLSDSDARSPAPGVYREDLRIEVLEYTPPPPEDEEEKVAEAEEQAEEEQQQLLKRRRYQQRPAPRRRR